MVTMKPIMMYNMLTVLINNIGKLYVFFKRIIAKQIICFTNVAGVISCTGNVAVTYFTHLHERRASMLACSVSVFEMLHRPFLCGTVPAWL